MHNESGDTMVPKWVKGLQNPPFCLSDQEHQRLLGAGGQSIIRVEFNRAAFDPNPVMQRVHSELSTALRARSTVDKRSPKLRVTHKIRGLGTITNPSQVTGTARHSDAIRADVPARW